MEVKGNKEKGEKSIRTQREEYPVGFIPWNGVGKKKKKKISA